MENIAVVIQKSTSQIVYMTTNSRILPKTEALDRYLADPDYRVVVDVQTARNGQVHTVGNGGQIVEVPLASLDQTIYHTNLDWSAEMFKQGKKLGRAIERLSGIRATIQENRMALLELTTDAADVSPLNNIPEIVADGRSTITIFIQKKSWLGKPLTTEADNDLVSLHTTRGTLSHRQVQLVRGQAQIRIRSSTDTVIADVTARGENLRPYMLHIEFAPPPDL